MVTCPYEFGIEEALQPSQKGQGNHRTRKRRPVGDIFDEQGPYYVRRAYRMDAAAFWELHLLLLPYLKKKKSAVKKHRDGAKNGLITTTARLSAAILYFAGGKADDIALVHGFSNTDVYKSVWRVVDAVNECPELDITFPSDYEKQREIARGFFAKSKVGFQRCCGAIDGMLVWTEKPTEADCKEAKVGPKKFMCGRKKKFGFNLQGTCDVEGRFLDVTIHHPASTSDYLALITSPLYYKLEEPDFLAPGLCLFGDNAYVNSRYMATPFTMQSSGDSYNYNFFHSSLRIKIECAFGMIVSRWGILRSAMSATIGLKKTTALVICLCRLHNYCINSRIKRKATNRTQERAKERAEETPPSNLAMERVEIVNNGGIPLVDTGNNSQSPEQLLHGGEHFDDVTPAHRQQIARSVQRSLNGGQLPRESLLAQVVASGKQRPSPKG